MKYSIQSLVKQLGQVEPDPGEVRPEPDNPEEPGPGDESELIEDDKEFDVVDGIDDDDLWIFFEASGFMNERDFRTIRMAHGNWIGFAITSTSTSNTFQISTSILYDNFQGSTYALKDGPNGKWLDKWNGYGQDGARVKTLSGNKIFYQIPLESLVDNLK